MFWRFSIGFQEFPGVKPLQGISLPVFGRLILLDQHDQQVGGFSTEGHLLLRAGWTTTAE